MNITLRQLRAFIKIVETGSFTEAASQLNLTQSALSGQIRNLETELGVTILDRTTRQVALSNVGSEVFPKVRQVLEDVDQLTEELAEKKSLRAGNVALAAPQLLACTLVPGVIGEFLRKHPKVRFTSRDVGSDEVIRQVSEGSADLAIGGERNALPNIEAELLFDLPFIAAMRADHPLAGRGQVSWSDIAKQRIICPRGSFLQMLNMDLHGSGNEATIKNVIEVSYFTTALSLVNEGLGITICQPYALPLIQLYGLSHQPIREPLISRKFYIYTRRDRSLSPAALALVNFLRKSRDQFGL